MIACAYISSIPNLKTFYQGISSWPTQKLNTLHKPSQNPLLLLKERKGGPKDYVFTVMRNSWLVTIVKKSEKGKNQKLVLRDKAGNGLTMLVDGGSSLSFLNESTSHALQCDLQYISCFLYFDHNSRLHWTISTWVMHLFGCYQCNCQSLNFSCYLLEFLPLWF